MIKYFSFFIALIAITSLTFGYPQGEGGSESTTESTTANSGNSSSSEDPCPEYDRQCRNGTQNGGAAANNGAAIYPNNGGGVNNSAIQGMPYCESLAQACANRGSSTPPSTPTTTGGSAASDAPNGNIPNTNRPSGFLQRLFSFE